MRMSFVGPSGQPKELCVLDIRQVDDTYNTSFISTYISVHKLDGLAEVAFSYNGFKVT